MNISSNNVRGFLQYSLLNKLFSQKNGNKTSTGVKTDNVMVALYVLPFLVLAVFHIGAHTGDCKIFLTAIQRGNAVIVTDNKPPVPVQCGFHGKLVMLKG